MTYALIVAALSLLGAALPLRFKPGHAALQVYLSLAAGALLGAGMFHLLPEASHNLHGSFGLPAIMGVLLVFFLQRYVAPHSHEVADGVCEDASEADPPVGVVKHEHNHAHDHGVVEGSCEHEHHLPSGPALGGLIAILALSVHSFFDGVAIGAATGDTHNGRTPLVLSVFLSVLIHKPMDGLSVSVLLLHAGLSTGRLWAVQLAYAALVPIGAVVFHFTSGAIADPSPLIGYTLAFSGGTFLAIALTDLLPELAFHSHDRNKLSAALLLGLAVMWFTSFIGHDSDEPQGHTPHAAIQPL